MSLSITFNTIKRVFLPEKWITRACQRLNVLRSMSVSRRSLSAFRQVRSPTSERPILECAKLENASLLLFEGELFVFGREHNLASPPIFRGDILPVGVTFALLDTFDLAFSDVERSRYIFQRPIDVVEEDMVHTLKLDN